MKIKILMSLIFGLFLIPNLSLASTQYFGEITGGNNFKILTTVPNTNLITVVWVTPNTASSTGATQFCYQGTGTNIGDNFIIGSTVYSNLDSIFGPSTPSGCQYGDDVYMEVFATTTPIGYWKLHWVSAGVWTTDSPDDAGTNTRIFISRPEQNSTTTTPVTFQIKYYINSTTNGNITPNGINLKIFNSMLASGTDFHNIKLGTITYDTLISTTTTIDLPNNQEYLIQADLFENEVPEECNNPLLAVAYCGWLQATQRIIAASPSKTFTTGTSPFGTVDDFGNSVFSAGGVDQGIFSGQCAFVATSTCEVTSINSWQGCMFNVGLRLFCPSTGAINYATSTLINQFSNKVPFGFFIQTIGKIQSITGSTTPVQGSDITVNIAALGSATTTVFSWSAAHDFMFNVIPTNTITIMVYLEWISFSIYAALRVSKLHQK